MVIRIACNPGVENQTLMILMHQLGFLQQFDVNAVLIETPGVAGPLRAILEGKADVCMTSGYNGLFSCLGDGAPIKIIGSGMKKVALALFADGGENLSLSDLQDKTIAVGEPLGLLHCLVSELFRAKKIDPQTINFKFLGSNRNCYQAVIRGDADACCASVSHFGLEHKVSPVVGGKIWSSLPRYIYQLATASIDIIESGFDELVRLIAAYGTLYKYLMTPGSQRTFIEARQATGVGSDEREALAYWKFLVSERPYSTSIELSEAELTYLQDVLLSSGNLTIRQNLSVVTDMRAAKAASSLVD